MVPTRSRPAAPTRPARERAVEVFGQVMARLQPSDAAALAYWERLRDAGLRHYVATLILDGVTSEDAVNDAVDRRIAEVLQQELRALTTKRRR